jgi:hypothetical protein
MNVTLTAMQAIEWVIRFLAVYILIDSGEKLYNFREFRGDGFFSWQALRTHRFFTTRSSVTRRSLDRLFDFRSWLFLLLLRGLGGVWLLCLPQHPVITPVCLLVLFIVGSLMNFRHTPYGTETENRFALMLCGALLLRSLVPTELLTVISLWFIALQSCLSYMTAGVTKWLNPDWKKGNGIMDVINSSDLVPLERTQLFFGRNPGFGKLLAWATIAFECLFPLALLGSPFVWLFLTGGVLFHLGIAVWLRLGKFFWVWMATYPAIIFIAQQ